VVVSAGSEEATKEMGFTSPVLLDQNFATGRVFRDALSGARGRRWQGSAAQHICALVPMPLFTRVRGRGILRSSHPASPVVYSGGENFCPKCDHRPGSPRILPPLRVLHTASVVMTYAYTHAHGWVNTL
jgi:hypothetical protein